MASLLLPYEKDWLRDKSRHKIGMMGRQCGKTFMATLEAVDDCLEAAATCRAVSFSIEPDYGIALSKS